MKAWIELEDLVVEDKIWERLYSQLKFNPSIDPKDWPAIQEPKYSITYSISSIFGNPNFNNLKSNLMNVFLKTFQSLLNPNEYIYALDWQHECYIFYPHKRFQLNEYNEWPIPILPNGDYYIFLEKNFKFGVFGHPWEKTICLFGKELVEQIAINPPKLFNEIVRRNA